MCGYEGSIQDVKQLVPCVALCLASADVPVYIFRVLAGRCDDAIKLIRKDNLFLTVCVYV